MLNQRELNKLIKLNDQVDDICKDIIPILGYNSTVYSDEYKSNEELAKELPGLNPKSIFSNKNLEELSDRFYEKYMIPFKQFDDIVIFIVNNFTIPMYQNVLKHHQGDDPKYANYHETEETYKQEIDAICGKQGLLFVCFNRTGLYVKENTISYFIEIEKD